MPPCQQRSSYANGSSGRNGGATVEYVARNFRNIGIRSEFNIENMKLFRGWLGGWLCAYDEISKRRECTRARRNYQRIKHGYAQNKFHIGSGKRGKGIHNFAFHPSDAGMLLIFHKYDGFDAVLTKRDVVRQDIYCAQMQWYMKFC